MAAGYIHKNALTFSMIMFGHTAISSLFNFYYVKLFFKIYGISEEWFQIVQLLYLIWNAVNDPLFAYLQDNSQLQVFRNRKSAIKYGAPLYILSFLLPWFPWGNYNTHKWLAGLHLLVSMSCYDAALTFVLLAYCALYVEISPEHEDRIRLTKYSQIAGMFGSCSVMMAEFLCDGLDDLPAFQTYVVFVALLSWATMHYTGKNVTTVSDDAKPSNSLPNHNNTKEQPSLDVSIASTFSQFKQIVKGRNFILFVATNFLQTFHTFYIANFLSIFVDELIPLSSMPAMFRKLLYGGTNIMVPVSFQKYYTKWHLVMNAEVLIQCYK